MTGFNLPEGLGNSAVSSNTQIITDERQCPDCGTEMDVVITCTYRQTDFLEEWFCAVCEHSHSTEIDYTEDEC